jgi:hypothetical protein
MEYKVEKKSAPGWDQIDVLGETYEPGIPQGQEMGAWRQKLLNRSEKLRYLESGERYYYGKEWYGSEKRKKPA